MPQAKGAGTWLTNVRQEASSIRVHMDNSNARIANKSMDHSLTSNLERLTLAKHRRRTDKDHDIAGAKGDADNFNDMLKIIKNRRVKSAQDILRKRSQSVNSDKQTGKVLEDPPSKQNTPNQTEVSKTTNTYEKPRNKSAVTRVRLSSRNQGYSNYNRQYVHHDVSPYSDQQGLMEPTLVHSDMEHKRPKKSMLNQNARPRPFSSALGYVNKAKRHKKGVPKSSLSRPHTSLGFSDDPSVPGRSFQELRDMTHIDKLTASERFLKRAELEAARQALQRQEQIRLEHRLWEFHKSLDEFKKQHVYDRSDLSTSNVYGRSIITVYPLNGK